MTTAAIPRGLSMEVQTQCRGPPTEIWFWSRGVCWRGNPVFLLCVYRRVELTSYFGGSFGHQVWASISLTPRAPCDHKVPVLAFWRRGLRKIWALTEKARRRVYCTWVYAIYRLGGRTWW
jgi:hypothetical protein